MYLEESRLSKFVEMRGFTYETTGGRNGYQTKTYPEVPLLAKLRTDLVRYVKILGFSIAKGGDFGDDGDGDDW